MNFLSFGPSSVSRNIIALSMILLNVAVKADLTASHYPFRECHAFFPPAFPWTANLQRIVALSKLNHYLDLLKCTSVQNTKSPYT